MWMGIIADCCERHARLVKGRTGSILIAPQFLNEDDVKAHGLPSRGGALANRTWEAGGPAVGPAGISAYEVRMRFCSRLADRTMFPDLKDIVLAGHSGGGQAVRRYAVVGKAQRRSRRRVSICGSLLRTRLRICTSVTTDRTRTASDAVGGIDGGMGHAALRSM